MNAADWIVIDTTEAEFNSTQLHHKETVFTLSNGYLGTRGAFEEGFPGACPATLINGVYDDVPIAFTELVNCPDWLPLTIQINHAQGSDRFRLNEGTVLSYKRWLNLYRGVLSRSVQWRSPNGYTLDLYFERFVSLANPHILAMRCQITPLDGDPNLEIHASLNGYADNQGTLHWDCLDQGVVDDLTWLRVRTRRSGIELGMAERLTLVGAEKTPLTSVSVQGYPTVITTVQGRSQQTITLDKIVTVFTSRDLDLGSEAPHRAALSTLASAPDYGYLLGEHEAAWAAIWQENDILIEGDFTAQLAVRYNLFQILSVAPRHDDRVSIPAKTLSGFAYRGHVFWDTEIFILPLLTFTQPALARNLLTYRYHTLAGARRKAQAAGYEGAMYVWESADSGDEVTPSWVPGLNTKELIRIWCGDIELHISTDVAYAAYQYWQITGDDEWMLTYGAEIILDTAVFWGSRAEWNDGLNRYEIHNVIGPDEYHEQVNNNAFTNRMVQWHLAIALEILNWLQTTDPDRADALTQTLQLTRERLHHWEHVIQRMWVAQDPDSGLIEQFQGFFDLDDIDLNAYEPRSRSMQAILGIVGANQRQVLKQADVLMLLYLLRDGLFPNASGGYDRQTLQANWDYYVPRTDHTYGSSLGPPVHAILACELGKVEEAYTHFIRTALVDLADVRGNAAEGIHAASAGGVWQSVVFGFGGVHVTADGLIATPRLPANWTRLKFQLRWRGQVYEFDLKQPSLEVQGVIFDLDGVLTDTSEFHYLGWKRLADEEGIPFDREANEALRGVSRRDSLLHLLQGRTLPEDQLQAMMDRKNGYYLDLIKTITPEHLLPGAIELLRELKAAGIKVAIGSASKNAKDVVQRLGIGELVDAIADGYSVTHSKPAPDVFLYAASQLGLDPAHCLVVEDAASGIEAGLRAGMGVVGLGPDDRVGAAHVVFPNLQDVTWLMLLEQMNQAMVGKGDRQSAEQRAMAINILSHAMS